MLVVLPSVLCADEQRPPRTISTSGEAIIYVQPDEVIFNFGVETRDASLDEAESANDVIASKLVAAVRELGVEEKHIQTDQLQVDLVYRNHNHWEIEGYEVTRSYCVRLKDTKKFPPLVKTVLKSGANRIDGFEFRTTELRKHRDKARELAMIAAKEKAEALASTLKCSVGEPRTIQESGGHFGYMGYMNRRGSISQNTMQSMPVEGGASNTQLPLGQIAVQGNVSVSFDLITPLADPS